MNKKELELGIKELECDIEELNRTIGFLDRKVDRMNETIASLENRLYHAKHPQTLREFMKSVEKEVKEVNDEETILARDKEIVFDVDFEKHRFSAESCKDFEKYYGKKLLDNTIVVECRQVNANYKRVEYVIDVETKGGKNE